jgi:hypothetical protein
MASEIIKDIFLVGGKKLSSIMLSLQGIYPRLSETSLPINFDKELKLRKLVAFPDKEGKTRIVGILDYFSQTALRPLHTWIFSVLKRIPQDRTFTQSEFMRT